MAYSSKRSADAGPDEVRALREALASDTLAPLYIFHGEEAYLRDHYLSEMKKLLCGELPELNFELFDGKSCTADALREAILAYPAFGGRRLVVARDFDILRASGSMADLARELFPNLPDTTTLVFLYDSIEYRLPGEKDRELLHLIAKHGHIVDFRRADMPALEKWVCSHFKALGKECRREEASYLILLCGGLMKDLFPEIQKVGHFAAGEAITRADIDAMATPTVEARVFDLTDAIIACDRAKALQELYKLYATREEPIMILGAVSNQIRYLYAACLLQQKGGGETELMRFAGIKHPYVAGKMLKAARRTDLSRARSAVRACAETDLALKSSGGDRARLLELLIHRLTGEAVD